MSLPATVHVVFDVESDPPQVLGTYVDTDEDTVLYERTDGAVDMAPDDCVLVVAVQVGR